MHAECRPGKSPAILALAILAVALLVLAGCGGPRGNSDGNKTETGSAKKKKSGQAKKDARSCEARGINVEQGREGTCIRDGTRFTVVDKGHVLRLREVTVRVLDVSTRSSLSGPVGVVKPEKGATFVLVELLVRNKSNTPEVFNRSEKQVRVLVAGAGFPVAPGGESVVPSSFFNQNRTLKPGQSQKGTAVFKMKSTAAQALELRGADPQVLIWNFSDATGQKPANGAVRLWQ